MVRGWRGRADREGGAVAVEFALVLVPFLLIVFGAIQYGMYFFASQNASNAVDSALRQLAVGNCQSDTELEDYIDARLTGSTDGTAPVITRTYYNIDGSTVTNSPAPTNVQVGGTVKLELTFQVIDFSFPFLPFLNDAQVNRTVQARVEDTVADGCGA